ncbi:hypothetical protein Rhal01_02661 [Rubritalea halochordaticola]|uniref:AtpZ/AtpI family protein n=1 Tax=Rubritalea halochordaticola TaxID=714537 RepID=A0ABP9V772_9BACT
MSNPYEPPESEQGELSPGVEVAKHAPLIGFLCGGCLLPSVVFLLCLLGGDVGEPLFWPVLAALTGSLGGLAGFGYQVSKRG